MKQIFEMKDTQVIEKLLDDSESGTLAICIENRPYSVPLNFVKIDNAIYFHGAKKGKKVEILKANSFASFSVVESHSLIQSYFSSDEGLACPATHFFKSIIVDGKVIFVDDYDEKVKAMGAFMQKLQPEGKYILMNDDVYKKAMNATLIYKLEIDEMKAKFKFGQNLTEERFAMIIEHLEQRATKSDFATIRMMKEFYNGV